MQRAIQFCIDLIIATFRVSFKMPHFDGPVEAVALIPDKGGEEKGEEAPSKKWVVVKEFEPPANTIYAGGCYVVSIIIVTAEDSFTAIETAKGKDTTNETYCKWDAISFSDLDDLTVIGGATWWE